MGKLLNIVTPLHEATKRNYLERMNSNKVEAMEVAKLFEEDYWDGDRRYGYGGYSYIENRWKPVAEELIKIYGLDNSSSILDVGCGKGFLLYEIQKILPKAKITGIDISRHGISNRHSDFYGDLFIHNAFDKYPFPDNSFDLVISLGTLHNFRIFDLVEALREIERVGKNAYVMVEGYRNSKELFNLECWALTAESLFHTDEWTWIYDKFGYSGDYEFIYFE